ncbi:MAG: hypothetical protein ABSB38_06395 [Dehalococcoidia bacterium]
MRLSDFQWVRSRNSVFGLCLYLVLLGLIIVGAAESIMPNDVYSAESAMAGNKPVIQVFKAEPMELDSPASAAVYTFKVKLATNVQISEAGTNIKNISNPSGATLQGTANGLPASSIPTDGSGKFVCTIVASNEYGTNTAALELSIAANLIPAGQSGSTDNQTKPRTPNWLLQFSTPSTSTPSTGSKTGSEPVFFTCPSSCEACLKPEDAASRGYTQRCSDQPCYYSPDNQQKWYCYSEPEGWCCANEKVSQTTKRECTQMGGSYWSTNQNEALQACQPVGWCCRDGNLYQATKDQCAQMGGSYWSTNQNEALQACQPVGWCCRDGNLYQSTQAQCTQMGGSYWSTNQAQVVASCRQAATCWCCASGKVFQTTQAQCTQSGGACYSTQSQADAACRQTQIRTPTLK